MRYLIGGAALLLAGIAAGTFFVLQALLDEERLEARVGEAVLDWTGRPLVVTGGVDLELLPQPVLTLHQPRLGSVEDGFTLGADRLDLDVELWSLLFGSFAVDQAHLVRPVLALGAGPETALAALADRLAQSGTSLPVRRLGVAGGTVATLTGEPLLQDVAGLLEREGDTGSRFEAEAQLAVVGATSQFRLEGQLGSRVADRPLPLQLQLQAETQGVTHLFAFRGQLRPAAATRGLAGEVTLELPSSAAPLAAELASLWPALEPLTVPDAPLGLAGEIAVELGDAVAPSLRLEQGSLVLAGQSLTLDLLLEGGVIPTLDLRLEADRLVLPGARADWAPVAWHLADSLPTALRGPIELRAAVVEWQDQTFRQVALDLALDGLGMLDVARATAVLPGPGDLAFSGRLGPLSSQPGPRLTGRLEAALQNPAELAGAIIGPRALLERSTTLAIETDLDWHASGLTLQNADLRLDALQAAGGLAYRAGEADGLPQLALWAAIDRLALDDVVDSTAPETTLDGLLDLAASTNLAIDLRVSRTSLGEARFGSLTARLDSTNGAVAIERLSLNDVAGSAVAASGRLHAPSRTFALDLALDVASLSRLLRLVGQEPPLALALLGPLNLRGELAGDPERAELTARLDADLFAARGVASITDWRERPSAALAFSLEAGEAAPLIRQLAGVAVNDPLLQGPLAAELEIDIDQGSLGAAVLELTLGPLVLALEAARREAGPGPLDRFDVEVGPLSIETVALLYRLATPPLDLVPGPPARWRGYWPAQDLSWDWLQARAAEATVTLRGSDPETPPIEIIGQLRDGAITVPAFRWAGDAGLIDAGMALTGRADGNGVDVSVDLALERFAAGGALAALGVAPEALGGTLDMEARLGTHGASLRDLVGNLEGMLDLVLTDGVLGAASPADGGILVERLHGALVVQRGVVAPDPDPIDFIGPDGVGRIDGYADLLAWIVDLELALDGHDGIHLVRQRLFGPLAEPVPLASGTAPQPAPAEQGAAE